MGLEGSGLTIASHVMMVIVLILLAVRVLRSELDGAIALAVRDHALTIAIAVAAVIFAMERVYYVFARSLRPRGLDLYSAHPAPEVLSLILTFGVYLISVPIVRARCSSWSDAARRIVPECVVIIGFWGLIAWWLY